MHKFAAAAVALTAFATSSAMATTFLPITPGIYNVTTEYTALNDTSGLCAGAGVVVGGFTTGNAYVGGAGGVAHSIVAQPSTMADGAPVQINNLTCTYGAFPATIATGTGSTPFTGGATCVASYSYVLKSSATYTITAGATGTSTINSVIMENTVDAKGVTTPLTTANSFHVTSSGVAITLTSPAGGLICTVSLDSLFVRIGK